jgi:hypothetical protein
VKGQSESRILHPYLACVQHFAFSSPYFGEQRSSVFLKYFPNLELLLYRTLKFPNHGTIGHAQPKCKPSVEAKRRRRERKLSKRRRNPSTEQAQAERNPSVEAKRRRLERKKDGASQAQAQAEHKPSVEAKSRSKA